MPRRKKSVGCGVVASQFKSGATEQTDVKAIPPFDTDGLIGLKMYFHPDEHSPLNKPASWKKHHIPLSLIEQKNKPEVKQPRPYITYGEATFKGQLSYTGFKDELQQPNGQDRIEDWIALNQEEKHEDLVCKVITTTFYYEDNPAIGLSGITLKSKQMGYHDDDIEFVQIYYVDDQPQYVFYSQHSTSKEGYWGSVDKTPQEDKHLIVYVAKDSHSNWVNASVHKRIGGFANDYTSNNGANATYDFKDMYSSYNWNNGSGIEMLDKPRSIGPRSFSFFSDKKTEEAKQAFIDKVNAFKQQHRQMLTKMFSQKANVIKTKKAKVDQQIAEATPQPADQQLIQPTPPPIEEPFQIKPRVKPSTETPMEILVRPEQQSTEQLDTTTTEGKGHRKQIRKPVKRTGVIDLNGSGNYRQFVSQEFKKRPAGYCQRLWMKKIAQKWQKKRRHK